MKIVSLKVKNIASLKGEHHVDFDQILNHSGVFAITGETGSGKSTILNSISLALYGQHYKKSNNQVDFVTLGEPEGEIELVYRIKNELFKAFWHLRLKKSDGKYLKKPQQERRYSKKVDNQWETIEASPEQTLNLSFEQFTKTIVLNQGEFAKFLSSGFKDRKDILSKLYDGEKLEQLSLHVRRKISCLKTEIETINAQILGINENSNFSLKEAQKIVKEEKDQKSTLERIYLNLEKSIKFLEDLYNHKENWIKNNNYIIKLKEGLNQLTVDFNKIKVELKEVEEKFNLNKAILKSKEPLLIECISKTKLLIEKNSILEKMAKEIKEATSIIDSEQKHIQELVKQNELFAENVKQIKSNKLFGEISPDEIEKAEIANKNLIKTNNDLRLLTKEKEIYQVELENVSKQGDDLKNEVSKLEVLQSEDKLHNQKSELNDLSTSLELYKKAQTTIETFITRNNELQKEDIDNKDLLKRNDKEISELEVKIQLSKERVRELHLAIKSFGLQEYINEISKASLADGECLVCHTKDISKISITKDTDKNEEEELQIKYENQNNELRNLEIKSQGLRSSQAHYRANIQKFKHDNQELIDTTSSPFSFINKDELVNNPKKILDEVTESIKHKEKTAQELGQAIETTQKDLQNLQNLQKGLVELRTNYKDKSEELKKLDEKIKNISHVYEALKKELEQIFKGTINSEQISDKITLCKDYNVYQQRIEDNNKSTSKSNDRLQSLIKSKKDSEENIKKTTNLIEELQSFLSKNSKGNPEAELSTIKAQVEKLNEQTNKVQRNLNDSKIKIAEDTSKQKNYEEQCEQTDNIFKLISIELCEFIDNSLKKEIKLKNVELADAYEDFFSKLNKKLKIQEVDPLILKETINFNSSLLNEMKTSIGDITHSIVKNETLIAQKQSAQDKVDNLNKEINILNQNKSELEDLYDLVGKDEFRNFVLSLIEKNLITQTNHELKHLCDDRYIIEHFSKNVQSMPDFYVVDKFKAGLTRKVSTLSGGETFMVSLAMALALAELTRGTSEVDSFFIDEGFGTLDDDSLEDVLDMINTMEQRGKSIGLISHIKKLTDRIGVNLCLEKSELGNSNISIKYN